MAPLSFVSSSSNKNYLGGARYSPTGLPLADTTPLKANLFEKHNQVGDLPRDLSGGSKSPCLCLDDVLVLCIYDSPLLSSLVTGDDSTVRASELPDVPCFLEPNNHVYLSGRMEVDQIAHLLEQVFAKCQVDYLFKPHKCKWKAARSKHHINVDFRTRVYLCPKGDFVVEFQKRKVSQVDWEEDGHWSQMMLTRASPLWITG